MSTNFERLATWQLHLQSENWRILVQQQMEIAAPYDLQKRPPAPKFVLSNNKKKIFENLYCTLENYFLLKIGHSNLEIFSFTKKKS